MEIELIEIGQRYLSHVEDDPMIWQKSLDDLDKLILLTEDLVRLINIKSGSGEGVVIDTLTKRIVACFGMDMPSEKVEEEHVVEVVMRWKES